MKRTTPVGSLATAILLSVLCVVGCGDGHDGSTEMQTPTPGASTPTPAEEHTEVLIGSTHAGGGDLKAEYEFDEPVAAHFSACLGGAGDECSGGVKVYSVVSPGFDALEEDEPSASHYRLIDGTAITLRVLSIDPGLSIRMGSTTVDSPGAMLTLGSSLFHADVEAQIAIANGEIREDGWRIAFELASSSGAYERSAAYTLVYKLDEVGAEP